VTISIGISQGPEHAMNPRELVACAEAAMMTAKARGKNRIVLFDDESKERPLSTQTNGRDVRSIAHMKMLQSLSGKLNRLNDVRQIGAVIADELRLLIDYHNCRVSVIEGDDVVPIAFRGDLSASGEEPVAFPITKIGEGITGHVAEVGRSLLVPNALECEYARLIPGTHVIEESMVAVPLRYGARVIGVIVISKLGMGQFDEDDVRLLEVLAGNASVALENARLYESQRREAASLKALLEFAAAISRTPTTEGIADETVGAAGRLLEAADASLWLRDATGELRAVAATGETGVPSGFDTERVYDLARHRKDPFLLGLSIGSRAAIAPLPQEGGLEGFIVVAEPASELTHFTEERLTLLAGISYQASIALANAGNFEGLETTFVSTVEALANALEANDEYTSSHTRWITDMSLKVGRELGFDCEELKRLELGALFHDIGKIGIPASILQKPAALTSEERAVMELHPELGERILAPIARLSEVRPIIRSCHERWDGDGYPDRKSGEKIPLESRIILVCDAFHAMTTDRPYRKRLPVEEACRRLREGAGTQLDPEVVDVFLRLEAEGAVVPPARAR
jgi:HD-GYP domain-containing protein (c-di-GMP phosphodiesterase class II)